jgi:hypothetical protein
VYFQKPGFLLFSVFVSRGRWGCAPRVIRYPEVLLWINCRFVQWVCSYEDANVG